MQSNIDGAGDSIGRITNRGTAEYCIRAKYESDSREYKELTARLKYCQLYQQDAIKIVGGYRRKRWIENTVNPEIWGVQI